MVLAPTIDMLGGLKMPMIGLGTWMVSILNAFSFKIFPVGLNTDVQI